MTPHKAPDLTMKPHKATEHQWGIVRRRAKNDFPDSTDSVLLELAHRVAAMESQHNLVVDSITDLQGCVNQLKAATSPPPAADHSRGATEMVATDKELCSLYDTRRLRDRSTIAALRAVYNLGRQHGAQARQEGEMVPVLWVRRKPGPGCNASVIAWLPGVGDLPIGEHILYAFPGTSQPRQEEEATPPPAES